MATKSSTTTTPSIAKGLKIEYVFDAPRQQVWRALTDPNQLKLWWGPKLFTAPIIRLDLKVGGKYLYCMRSPEGKDYFSTGVFREIKAPERLVYTDSFADPNGNIVSADYYGMSQNFPRELIVTITLDEYERGKTRLSVLHGGMPEGEDSTLETAGWIESFDKLAKILKQ